MTFVTQVALFSMLPGRTVTEAKLQESSVLLNFPRSC